MTAKIVDSVDQRLTALELIEKMKRDFAFISAERLKPLHDLGVEIEIEMGYGPDNSRCLLLTKAILKTNLLYKEHHQRRELGG